MFSPKKILVPTDFSVYADDAIKQAIDIAKQYKAQLYMLHVVDEKFQQCAADYCVDEATFRKILKESVDGANDKLREEVKKITGDHAEVEITYDVIKGNAYEEIIREQENKGIDLIVIASHGKTGILKNLMGGVVEKVIKRVKCPVLLIRS